MPRPGQGGTDPAAGGRPAVWPVPAGSLAGAGFVLDLVLLVGDVPAALGNPLAEDAVQGRDLVRAERILDHDVAAEAASSGGTRGQPGAATM